MRELAHHIRESKLLNEDSVRQMSQIRQCKLLPG